MLTLSTEVRMAVPQQHENQSQTKAAFRVFFKETSKFRGHEQESTRTRVLWYYHNRKFPVHVELLE